MKKISLISLSLLCLLHVSVFAQEETTGSDILKSKHELGIAAGFSTGFGISYRYFPCDFGAQLTFAPIVDGNSTLISSGLTFMYRIIETEKSKFFLYQGNHLLYEKRRTVDKNLINSLGIGIELVINNRVGINLMGGFAGYESFTQLSMTGEVGLFYKL